MLVSRALLVFLVTRLLRWYLAHLKCYPNVTLVSRALLVFLVTQLLRWYLASIWCATQSKIALRNKGVYFNKKKNFFLTPHINRKDTKVTSGDLNEIVYSFPYKSVCFFAGGRFYDEKVWHYLACKWLATIEWKCLSPRSPPPTPHTHTNTQKQNKTKQKKHWENLDGKLDENEAVLKQFAPRKNENTFVITEKNCPLTLENVDFRSLRM